MANLYVPAPDGLTDIFIVPVPNGLIDITIVILYMQNFITVNLVSGAYCLFTRCYRCAHYQGINGFELIFDVFICKAYLVIHFKLRTGINRFRDLPTDAAA